MTESLAAAEARFLAPANLTEGQLATQLGAMLRGDIDFADLYFQHAEQQAFVLEDGRVRDASFSIDHGVGLRAVAGAKTGFAYANGIDSGSLAAAAAAAVFSEQKIDQNLATLGLEVIKSVFTFWEAVVSTSASSPVSVAI